MFSGFWVVVKPPCWNTCATAASWVPMPMPLATADDTEFAYMSVNCAVAALKPVVFAFAMLLPITSRSFDAPCKPLKPCW